jgi:hypothetical protein
MANGDPSVTLTGGGGAGAVVRAIVNYQVRDLQIINPGRDYTNATAVIGHGGFFSAIRSGDKITGVMINNPGGVIWTKKPTVRFVGGGGVDAAAEVILEGGRIIHIKMTNEGHDYTSEPAVYVDICSEEATADLTITNGRITGGTITSEGEWYTDAPICIVLGDGYGAEIVPFVSGKVTGYEVIEEGTGFTSAPGIVVAHPNGDDITHPKPNGHRLMAHRYCAGIEQLLAS